MVLLITLIGIIIGAVGYVMYQTCEYNSTKEKVGEVVQGIGWTIAGIAAFAAIVLLVFSVVISTADEKIEMYQEENTKIEQQIAEVVKNYQEYETDIFTELSPESAMSMISLYPELKSDKLVESQIEVYVENNKQIKYFKEQFINRCVVNWWLYFGK